MRYIYEEVETSALKRKRCSFSLFCVAPRRGAWIETLQHMVQGNNLLHHHQKHLENVVKWNMRTGSRNPGLTMQSDGASAPVMPHSERGAGHKAGRKDG